MRDESRRAALKDGAGTTVMLVALAAGIGGPGAARADWNKAAFDVKGGVDGVVKALGGAGPATASADIVLNAPDIAENGAVVPIGVTSRLPGTQTIAILVEKNPNTLAAHFVLGAASDPSIATRVKMGQSSDVYALVRAEGRYYFAKKEVKVTLGGCGG